MQNTEVKAMTVLVSVLDMFYLVCYEKDFDKRGIPHQ